MDRAETLKQLMKTQLHSSPSRCLASATKPSDKKPLKSSSTLDDNISTASAALTNKETISSLPSNAQTGENAQNSSPSSKTPSSSDSPSYTRSMSDDTLEELSKCSSI